MENTSTNLEKTESNNSLINKTFEYVLLSKLDYEYLIEDFIIDTNNFKNLEEKDQTKRDDKEKKKLKNQKEKSNKNKKTGKKKPKEEEDLNLSKASSNLSIFSIKSKTGNTKQTADQKIKAKQKTLNVNVLVEKIKNKIGIIKTNPIIEIKEIAVEETIDTNIKQEELEDDNLIKKTQTEKKKDKKKNDKKKEKAKLQIEKIETKPAKEEKSNLQNKIVEDFLKSVKDKKTSKAVKEEKKISIKSEYISSHKYLFTVDPTQKLKLRSLYKLDKEAIQSFFTLASKELNLENASANMDSSNLELFRTNLKETAFLIDNLCDMSPGSDNEQEMQLIIGKSLEFILISLNLNEKRVNLPTKQIKADPFKVSLENFIMNLLYIVYKYQMEGYVTRKENIEQVHKISKYLTDFFKISMENYSEKNNLNTDDNISFFFFAYSLCMAILSFNKDETEITEHFSILNSFTKILFNYLHHDKQAAIESDFDSFIDEYYNLRFFTRLSYLFDKVRPNLLGLSMKVSKAIELNLVYIQNNLIKRNEVLFAKLINQIILNYVHNFEIFYEMNENLYEEIFALIKYLCDDKVFSINGIKEVFIVSKDVYDKRLELEHCNFLSDDTTGKYIGLLIKYIKYFERVLSKEDQGLAVGSTEHKLFLFFFHQVLFSILNLRQGYVREKYHKLIEKLIEPYLYSDKISEMIFEFITDFIRNNLLKEFDGNMIKNIKIAKDLTKFYSGYAQIKQNILKIFDKSIKNKIEFNLFTLFYLNFLNLKKKEDVQLLHSLIEKSENFIENILLLDRKLCSFIMKNYVNDEINSLDAIISLIFTDLINNNEEKNIPFENLFNYLLNFMENIFSDNDSNSLDKISNMKLATDLIEKLINLNLINFKKLELMLNCLLKTSKDIKPKSDSLNILKTVILFILNKMILITEKECDKKTNYEKFSNICDYIKKELTNTINSTEKEFSIIKEISLINDNLKTIQPKDYIRTYDDYFIFTIETLKLQQLLVFNQDYFIADKIEIEKIEQINENEVKVTKDSDNEQIDFDVILHGYINYLTHISGIFSKYNSAFPSIDTVLFNVNILQASINIVLSCDKIFSNLLKNKDLLEVFVRQYVSIKELGYNIDEDAQKALKAIESSKDSLSIIEHQQDISRYLSISELNSQIAVSCGEFIKNRCRNQIVFLFKEQDIYKMYLTKDKEFLQLLYEKLDGEYKRTILSEDCLKSLLSKAQNEEEDLLEDVIYSIFSEKIIKYLEYPEEIIEFLTSMNEAMKYDLKVDTKKYYNAILSYFYTWKSIMSKIENGFKLYTTEKNLVTTIDSYKTLLKFIVNYLEKNNKIYEMFLLLTVSFIHLIDEGKSLEDKSSNYPLDKFDDSTLTDTLDSNTFQFLLSVLYKFVKIFPSLVKFYYEETKTKLKNTFKSLNTNIILPKMLSDLGERIHANKELLSRYQIRIRDTKSLNYLEFDFNANDEIKFVIEIRIPPIFPLKKLDISFKCNALIDERKLLNVKMNLNQTLNSSIDNITDNLINWSENVKQLIVVGNEPCPICYSYLHPTDKSLPSLTCRTCKKKFHSLCIKEWFKNLSQNMQATSCPMCRSQWKL